MAYCKLFILPVAYSLIAFSGCDQTDRSTGASTPQPSVIDEPPGGPGPPVEPEVTEMPVVTVSSDLRHNHQRSVNVFRVAMGFGSGRVLAIPVQVGEIWADHAGRRWEVQEVEFLGIAEHSAPTIVSNERPAAVAHQLTQFDEAQPRIESSGIGVITEDMPTQKEMEVHMMNEKANATERSPNVFETQLIERMLEDKDSPGPWLARAEKP